MARRPTTKTNAVEEGSTPPPPPRPASPFSTMPKGWQSAAEVLDLVTAVPTMLPDYDRALRTGGQPVRRLTTVHGPTHGGKSAFIAALLRAFLQVGHPAAYVDAEHATDRRFFEQILGEHLRSQIFFGSRPKTYEETIADVDNFLAWVGSLRRGDPNAKKPVAPRPDLCSILAVDSINKLTPAGELAKVIAATGESKKDGAKELAKGHQGRDRARLNQAWLDHLIPLLGAANCALVLIAQERGGDEDAFEMLEQVGIKGGGGLVFDASVLVRVEKAQPVFDGEGDAKRIVGFRHRLRIHKSKVGHMDGRWSDAYFHLSNGTLTPPGLDTARDALEVGKKLELVKTSGAWLSWGGRRWQGDRKAVVSLTEDRDALGKLLAAIAEKVRAT